MQNEICQVREIYSQIISSFNGVLVGQEEAKKALACSLLCDQNSRILFTGSTGMGKTTLAKYLGNNISSKRISITSDMIPSDIYSALSDSNFQLLHIDEFNRVNGKTQSALIEVLAENQISIGNEVISFPPFYVIASQNAMDISGIFNIPQAIYDRFDVNIYFRNLTEDEKRKVLFSFEPKEQPLDFDIACVPNIVNHFMLSKQDEEVMMKAFSIIDQIMVHSKPLFSGSNIRAHRFAIKLAKINAMINGRNYLLGSDLIPFIHYLYQHRINQNVARTGDYTVYNAIDNAKNDILSLKRK